MADSLQDPEILVHVENVSKKFCRSLKKSLWYGVTDVASALNPFGEASVALPKRSISPSSSGPCPSDLAKPLPALRPDEFWAVQNVSFQLRRGECLGLIGHNGAGKSTLLKVLHGLIPPDTGRITMKGRVAALIELNAGFNPILSGRENIYNQAALLGFSKAETRAKFDAIVEFSEIGEFLEMPVQNYSSGMRVRLGFAVAAQLEPDVLIIDEVLAVGDVGFRTKCLSRMGEMLKTSAFIFVSHAMPQVARISTSVLHMDQGKTLLLTSNVSKGLDSYYASFGTESTRRSGNGQVVIHSLSASSLESSVEMSGQLAIGSGETIELRAECEFLPGCDEALIQYVIYNQELSPVMDIVQMDLSRCVIRPGKNRRCIVSTRIAGLSFNSGRYSLSLMVLAPDYIDVYAQVDQAVELHVTSIQGSACPLIWPCQWASEPV